MYSMYLLFHELLQPAEVTRKMLRDRHNKKNPTQLNPVFPNWVYDRPALIGDFVTGTTSTGEPPVAVGRFFRSFIFLINFDSL